MPALRVGVDPLEPMNHGIPLWVVYGASPWWPQIICAQLLPYSATHCRVPVGTRGHHVCIWGASRWSGRHDFRTLGIDVEKWSDGFELRPAFFDVQAAALEHLDARAGRPGEGEATGADHAEEVRGMKVCKCTDRIVGANCIDCFGSVDHILAREVRLESVLRALLHSHNGTHAEDCGAYGVDDDEVIGEEGGSDPYCYCGATKARNEAREALKEGTE
jgi:hypothetical protein